MPLPESLEGRTCEELASRWGISAELATRLLLLDRLWASHHPNLGHLRILSGYRSREEQAELERAGRPAAPDQLSTHRSCPATGADLLLPIAVDDSSKVEFGRLAMLSGLRWGGGSPPDPAGIPVDWNHVDLGPRG